MSESKSKSLMDRERDPRAASRASSGAEARQALLATLPVREVRRELAGVSSAVLEGGQGSPLVLLHGPGGNATHWLRILPALCASHRVIAPDLPGHGDTGAADAPLDRAGVRAWLEALIEDTCATPPALIGELLGGALALCFAAHHARRIRQLVLVDSFGLAPFEPAPEFARALRAFNERPDEQTHGGLWQGCAHDLAGLRAQMGALWRPFQSYNVACARDARAQATAHALMLELGLAARPAEELARIALPTALIWGRHDLATPLAVAEAASRRHGWPLHVIEHANDAPAIEQPEAFMRALHAELKSERELPAPGATPARGGKQAARETVDTLVIGGGQAGLATSYWLTQAGVQHLVLEARARPGGSWHDRWDSFHLVAPNFTLLLPGMPYAGPDLDAFMPRDQVIDYVKTYAESFAAPLRLASRVTRLTLSSGGAFEAHTDGGLYSARRVVLATGAYAKPKVPALSSRVPAHIQQLHSNDYRRPAQLAEGAVLVVGTGQSGAQISEELQHAGRDVHLAASMCGSVPRRYRGRDIIWWLLQSFLHGAEYGVRFPMVDDLPTPAARFACNPHLSGNDGGHDISLRRFARQGMHLYGALQAIEGSSARFTADLEARLLFAESRFDEELRPLFDAYIAAAGIDAPPDDRPAPDRFMPAAPTELDLDRAGIHCVLWATGYRPDFSWVQLPVCDGWGYPRHVRGVTTEPGLYVVGLPWLHSEPSSVFAGVGADARYIVEHLVAAASTAQGR